MTLMPKHYLKLIRISALTLSVFFVIGCFSFEKKIAEQKPLTEREKLYEDADSLFREKNFSAAKKIFAKLNKTSDGPNDVVYQKSLWKLSKIYEQYGESDKALLALEELSQRDSFLFPKFKIRFAQLKNHFVAGNTVQALEIKKEIDQAYKNNIFSLEDLYIYLLETSDLNYKHQSIAELEYLGEVQKYYIFIIESQLSPYNENLTEQLIEHYSEFIKILETSILSSVDKKQLNILLIDQLAKVNQYKIDDYTNNDKALGRFIRYAQKQHKLLSERLFKL